MGSVVALIVMCFIAYVIVLAGGTAYELTGLDRETAHFQALSAFTGTGFTTRESERVLRHPLRRQITTILIVFGYAGTATVVATLVRSVDVDSFGQTVLNLAVLAVVTLAIFFLIRRGVLRFLDQPVRRWVARRFPSNPLPHDDLLTIAPGYGVSKVAVNERSRLAGKTLRESGLRDRQLTVLSVEGRDGVNPVPHPDMEFKWGDKLIVYGELRRVEEIFG
ncbi:MAG: TrkA C-terminal domain-containing protein [Myxococcota bacterium]|nr:TrkA C-terminal domain-containing protein [Myxococcota bacterium]